MLCIVYAVVGANVYMSMEVPNEEAAYQEKQAKAQDIIDAMEFMSGNFWEKIHSENPEKRLNETGFYDKVVLHSI